MAGFFLAYNDAETCIEKAEQIFTYRGFKNGKKFSLSCGELLLYSKQNIDVENYRTFENGAIYSIGTVVYCGKTFSESLDALYNDFIIDNVDYESLIGAFVVLVDYHNETFLLTDSSHSYKLFTDSNGGYLSSSFLACVACTKSSINKAAVAEQMLYGFVSSPDTIVEDIHEIRLLSDRKKVDWITWKEFPKSKIYKKSKHMAESVCTQATLLSKYMTATKSLCKEFGSECGLSGGCDSRLIFCAANRYSQKLKSVHTHRTSAIHEDEVKVVEKLAYIGDVPLKIVPTTYLLECDANQVSSVIHENIMYFDGRNADAIGAFSQTHTRDYKKKVSGEAGVTFSGIGGEIYRNFYYTNLPIVNTKKWLESRVFIPCASKVLGDSLYKQALERIFQKIEIEIGKCITPYTGGIFAKRYFDGHRIPNALSNVINANNQMSFYLAPFTELEFIKTAAPDYKWQDRCGEYEGKIISFFSKEASRLITSKGYVIAPLPLKTKTKWLLRSYLPSFVWEIKKNKTVTKNQIDDKLNEIINDSEYLKDAIHGFKKILPDINIDLALSGEIPLNNVLFTICTVSEVEKIMQG